ncbi:MAG: zinc ribbon domain-containing protein [Alphaproteobacteria bacterium]|nr:zinc ribbon domain-containing protein [Alphaproteobacteria bacterium]
MGAFTTKKTLYGNPSQIPAVAEQIRQAFVADGYEVRIDNPANDQEIYITKGGFVKAALGLRSALKVTMKPTRDGNINFEAGVSIFKQQFVPTVITMCFFSPVVIAQIWGMIKQSKLDEKAVAIAERALYQTKTT